MSVYKDGSKWRVIYRYTDSRGERKQTQKRGFSTKKEAQAWEREQMNKTESSLDMTFEKLFGDLLRGHEEASEGQHMAHQRAYPPHQADPVLREKKDVRHSAQGRNSVAE